MILLLAGCGVFGNTAPKLISINGAPVVYLFGLPLLVPQVDGAVGEDLPLVLEIDDAENDTVNVWFPHSPDGLVFPFDATTGVWHVPADPPPRFLRLELVLEDTNRFDPRSSEYEIPFTIRGLETGDTAGPDTDTGRR